MNLPTVRGSHGSSTESSGLLGSVRVLADLIRVKERYRQGRARFGARPFCISGPNIRTGALGGASPPRTLVTQSARSNRRQLEPRAFCPYRREVRRVLYHAAVFFLLFSFVGLSTAAKASRYLPHSHPARHVTKLSKVTVDHFPAVPDQRPLHPVSKVAPPRNRTRTPRWERPEESLIQSTCVSVSFQHRSPPFPLA